MTQSESSTYVQRTTSPIEIFRSQNCVAFDLSFQLIKSLTPLEQPGIQKQDLDVHEAIESRVFTVTTSIIKFSRFVLAASYLPPPSDLVARRRRRNFKTRLAH